MIFDEITHIGSHHTQHNEDQLINVAITSHQQLIAVMDGCSMGQESHFASTLIKKCLSKIAHLHYHRSFYEQEILSNNALIKHVLIELHQELKQMKQLLMLETNELLSTLLIAIVDKQNASAEVICIGDGLLQYDTHNVEWDQENQPDYLAYHLMTDSQEWYESLQQRVTIDKFQKLSICTDGIFTFRNKDYELCNEKKMIQYLLLDSSHDKVQNPLHNKLITLRQQAIQHTDDLSIISVYHE